MDNYIMGVRTAAESKAEVAEALARILGRGPDADGEVIVGALSASVPEFSMNAQVVLSEALGAPATAAVSWGVQNHDGPDDFRRARALLATAAVRLAEELDADAFLSYETDVVLMRRMGGRIALYSWFPEWSREDVQADLTGSWTIVDDDPRL